MSGKGSKPRPYSVDKEQFDKNWEAIFGKKNKDKEPEEKKTNTDSEKKEDK